jgi:hypothetical protein
MEELDSPNNDRNEDRENRFIAVFILTLGIRWRWVVNDTPPPRPFYPLERPDSPL